jgi:hypothetical protein
MLRNMNSPCFNDYPPSNIIAAKGRLSTNFAIVVSFDVKEAAVLARLARTTVTVMSKPRGAIQATSLRDTANVRLNPQE